MIRLMMFFIFISTSLIANDFKIDSSYSCLNTHSIQQGQEIQANPDIALKYPFKFTLNDDDTILTTDQVLFEFKMQKGTMKSYSNPHYMLLLTPNMQLGLIPKKAQGTLQYFFNCKEI